jgi:hypothetical protein
VQPKTSLNNAAHYSLPVAKKVAFVARGKKIPNFFFSTRFQKHFNSRLKKLLGARKNNYYEIGVFKF